MTAGRVHQLNISQGGVPKLSVQSIDVTPRGIVGDAQADTRHHGGPERAVCLFSLDVIEKLNTEGHPIVPGSAGENITVTGLDWSTVRIGSRFLFDSGVALEVASYTKPCSGIRESFKYLQFNRIWQDAHPGWSRVYTRVLTPGRLVRGETIRHTPPHAQPTPAAAPLTPDRAAAFARAWYAAWNARDLDAIMALYAPAIEHSSPFIARYTNDPTCAPLKGKDAVRGYFGRALERNPTLRFDPLHTGVGVTTVNLVYRRMTGDLAVEIFFFDHAGLIIRSISHYES